jgi:beta-lactamase regulating signal transducer with metallopeptidase domain
MTSWLAETFVTTTVLLLLVLALRRPVASAFGAGWAYALWAVPAVRLFLPPLPQLTPDIQFPAAIVAFPATVAGGTAPLPADAGSGQWTPLILAVWAGGAVIFLTLQWLSYRAFLHRLDANARPARPPSQGGIEAVVSDDVDGPLALGLLRPRIVLPADFERRYSPDERRLALAHEITHHRRGDIWWNLAATLVLAFNWFNPVAWVAHRAFRADQELACDAAVAASASGDERCDYARALVKSASRPGLVAACALDGAAQLKQRLRMMRAHRVSPVRRAGGSAALCVVVVAGFAVGSPAVTEAVQDTSRLARATGGAMAMIPVASPPPALTNPQPAAAAKLAPRPRAQPAPRRAAAPAAPAPKGEPLELVGVPNDAIAAPKPRTQVRIIRLTRLEGTRPLPPEAPRVVMFRASGGSAPRPEEIVRAIESARGADGRFADAGATIRQIRAMIEVQTKGE